MSTKRQTFWLLTMLTLLIVLSVYYLFYMDDGTAPADSSRYAVDDTGAGSGRPGSANAPADAASKAEAKSPTDRASGAAPSPADAALKTAADDRAPVVGGAPTGGSAAPKATAVPAEDDYFATARLERDQARAREMERYFKQLGKGDEAAAKEVSARLDRLEELESKEQLVESLIRAKGYADAVVMADGNRVNVVVRSPGLKPDDVVSIIQLVATNMGVRGTEVTVSARP
ncbi:MAG: SpoIIIAH-like family protein [Hydrogenibacillus schlegelii]|nr:SpoIIIAH-like family protein [Hydrogenibacillus schlegelii]